MIDKIRGIIQENKDAYIADLITLCSQLSISSERTGIYEMANLLQNVLNNAGIESEVLETAGFPVVYGEIKGTSDKTVLFYNHYDVQPVDPIEEWTSHPFQPVIRKGRLFARGATDNKGNIAARINAVKTLQKLQRKLPVNIKFLIEGEEEVGSKSLPDFIIRNKERLKADVCIWEDNLGRQDSPLISLGSKGMLYIDVECQTARTTFHSSFAPVFPNAAWRLVQALSTIKDASDNILIDGFYKNVREYSGREQELLMSMPGEDTNVLKEMFSLTGLCKGVNNENYRQKLVTIPTCNISGIISGYVEDGTKTLLPNIAKAKIDMRLVPDQLPEEIFEKLQSFLKKKGYGDITLTERWSSKPSIAKIDQRSLDILVKSAKETFTKDPVIELMQTGATPTWMINDLLNIPVYSTGVGHVSHNTHAVDENIQIDEYLKGIELISMFILGFDW